MKNKKTFLGIDIGSIAISIVESNEQKEIIRFDYLFHEGNIETQLTERLSKYDLSNCMGIALTTGSPELINGGKFYDSRISIINAVKSLHKENYSILNIGGEKFGLISFDENGEYLNYKSNTSCAAGTGSFLNQQAKRLNLKGIEEFSEIAYGNKGDIPKIASRCAVFAKTDLIHAQQEGYSLGEICDGLSEGLAKNIADTLFAGEYSQEKIIAIGGVSKNKAVIKHISDIIGVNLFVPENSELYGAIGAVYNLIDEKSEPLKDKELNIENIISIVKSKKDYYYDELKLSLSDYPDFSSKEKYNFETKLYEMATEVQVDIYEELSEGNLYNVYMGIDIGSTSSKATIVDEDEKVLVGLYTSTSGRPIEAVQTIFEAIDDIIKNKSINFNFLSVGTTGSGRKFIGKIINSDIALDEITAHARAAYSLDEDVDTIIEIGGQDAKFTTLKNGMVTFSIMNNVCAAGTGSFIEEQAKKLDCTLDEYSGRAEGQKSPLASDRCTVFMERDLNHYLSEGYSKDEILASVLHSVRENYLTKVAIESNIGEKIFFQGATAKNRALVAAFEQRLKKPIMVSKYCHLTGALGTALFLKDNNVRETGFRGLDIYKKAIPVVTEICELCNNNCKIRVAEVNNELTAFGFLCGRDYETKKFVKEEEVVFNLIKERNKIFKTKSPKKNDDITIGIPDSLHIFEELPLWKDFFNQLSINVITSEKFKDGVKNGKKISGAEFCAPISSLHGNVQYLIEKADYVFLPVYLEIKQQDKNIKRQYCYYTQFSHSIVKSLKLIDESKVLTPVVKSLSNSFSVKIELYKMLKKVSKNKISFMRVSNAYDMALENFDNAKERLKKLYLKESKNSEDVNVVLLGRPYTILSNKMNSGIIDIFQKNNIKVFYQDMLSFSDDDVKPVKELLDAIYWNYASKILESAEYIAKDPNSYPVFVTSFKCTPDSYTVEYFKKILDAHNKPYLILQLDEHDSSVGYETRIEAGIRSFRNHASKKNNIIENVHPYMKHDIKNKLDDIKDMTLLLPNWSNNIGNLMVSALKGDGYDARLLEENNDSIQRSLSRNTGQCIPLSIIAQNTIDYVQKYNLDPKKTCLWNIDSKISCNIGMFPHYSKHLFEEYGGGMEKLSVYTGEVTFVDFSIATSINMYFAYMFGGMLTKVACKVRPYEVNRGETNRVMQESLEIFQDTFLHKKSKEDALKKVVGLFKNIKTKKEKRPKVAIFGDLYSRDNNILNQNLIETIENNGGEAITTPYSELFKIIAQPYIKKWFKESLYSFAATASVLSKIIPLYDKRYYKYFNEILQEKEFKQYAEPEEILSMFNVKIQNTGESLENVLKIFHLINHYDDISLFVQANPAFCCPSLVTQAMTEKIEEITGIPIVTIEYDGTGGEKNDDIIPYLKYPREKAKVLKKEIV